MKKIKGIYNGYELNDGRKFRLAEIGNNNYKVGMMDENGKRYAYVVMVSSSDNLLPVLAKIKGIEYANAFTTRKEAAETVEFWNECYKNNGTYMFSEVFA